MNFSIIIPTYQNFNYFKNTVESIKENSLYAHEIITHINGAPTVGRTFESFDAAFDKAKVTLRFRGREMAHPEIGMKLMERVEEDLEPMATVEATPKFEGRQVTMVLAPRKKKG